MNKSKEFLKNTIILFIGKFSTQFMTFLLLPLYTHYLETSDYGFIDLVQTYISLFIPILTLRFDSAAFRFLIDVREDKKEKAKIISNILISLIFQIVFFASIFIIINMFFTINYNMLICFNVITMMTSNVLLQMVRGLGKNKEYSIACIITGFSTLLINIILIIGFKFSASSILIATSIANLICSVFLLCIIKLPTAFSLKNISKDLIIKIAKYSVPMIPTSLSWWIVNVSDRSIISFFIGAASNGIYSVACKFSIILNSIFNIFNLSWQETASMNIDKENASEFFSETINEITKLFITITICLLMGISVFFNVLIGQKYIDAYNFIPILLIANIFNVYIGLYGGIFVAKKMTKEVAKTTILSAGLNIIINLMFISKIGLYAAALSTLISYGIIAIYRHISVQKYIKIKLNKSNILCFILLILSYVVLYYINLLYLNIIALLVSIILLFIFNKNYILNTLQLIFKRRKV